jgi:Zn-dependent M28 family amino/carboxypeptidase
MRRWQLLLVGCFLANVCFAQTADSTNTTYLKRIVGYLASEELKGRGNYTPELYKAAKFIAAEMKAAGLAPFPGYSTYLTPFQTGEHAKEEILVDSANIPKDMLVNVVGILPGKTKPGEAILISAHFDHVGEQDGIYYGANDNASGVAAMLAIMHHYSLAKNNERTLIFCAFSGEELGLYGSLWFREQVEPSAVKAVINLEMLGQSNAIGRKRLMLTGPGYSDLFDIMKKRLKDSPYNLYPEIDPGKQLFQRSDNFPFHALNIPSHTLMSSDDDHPCYHQTCDKAKSIDYENMLHMVKAILIATASLIDGTDTPVRKDKVR